MKRLTVLAGIVIGLCVADATQADVSKGMFAFNQGEYRTAFSEFTEAAKTGDAQAQTRLAEMYERDLGVSRDYVRAHAWYNVASALGNVLARTRRDALAKRMSVDSIARAQKFARNFAASPDPVSDSGSRDLGGSDGTITAAFTFGTYDGRALNVTAFDTYLPSGEANQIITDILRYNSIAARNFVVRASPQVPNAAAAIHDRKNYILYNPDWMSRLTSSSRKPWEVYSVLAHEIGHHVNGHPIEGGGSRPNKELEADYFSGGTLFKMGASLDESLALMRRIGSPTGSATHPAKKSRLDAIDKGWRDAKAQRGGLTPTTTPTVSPPTPTAPWPSPVAQPEPAPFPGPVAQPQPSPFPGPNQMGIAVVCAISPVDGCRMMVPIPVGASCVCFTPMGMMPGIAR